MFPTFRQLLYNGGHMRSPQSHTNIEIRTSSGVGQRNHQTIQAFTLVLSGKGHKLHLYLHSQPTSK